MYIHWKYLSQINCRIRLAKNAVVLLVDAIHIFHCTTVTIYHHLMEFYSDKHIHFSTKKTIVDTTIKEMCLFVLDWSHFRNNYLFTSGKPMWENKLVTYRLKLSRIKCVKIYIKVFRSKILSLFGQIIIFFEFQWYSKTINS